MGRDADRDQDGDRAAWRDLVARFELPQASDPALPPWPDRENLNPADELGLGGQSGSRSDSSPGARTPATRGRVIKPARAVRYSMPADGQSPGTAAGQVNGLGEATTHPDLGSLGLDDEDDNADERYIPPHVPPLPKLDPVARGAWTALFGGPGYLFAATALSWQVPGWAELAAIIAFVAGFVVLVSRLGDGPSRRDGPDQGAVV
jgi:hypothetical protein